MNGSGGNWSRELWAREMIFRTIYHIEIPSICLLGLVGNGMGILLLQTNAQLRRLPSRPFLFALAVFSTVFLSTILLVWLETVFPAHFTVYSSHPFGCKLITFAGGASDFACIWFIVAISVDRFVILYWPMDRRAAYLSNKHLLKKVAIFIIIVSCLLHIWILVIAEVTTEEGCGIMSSAEGFWEGMNLAETVYSIIVPSALVLITNILVAVRLAIHRRRLPNNLSVTFSPNVSMNSAKRPSALPASDTLETAFNGPSPKHGHAGPCIELSESRQPLRQQGDGSSKGAANWSFIHPFRSRRRHFFRRQKEMGTLRPQDIRITRTLLTLTSSFVLLNLPHYLYRVVVPFDNTSLWATLALHVSYFLYYSHHGLIFFTYIFNSRRLRRQLRPTALRLLECYCLKNVPDFGHASREDDD